MANINIDEMFEYIFSAWQDENDLFCDEELNAAFEKINDGADYILEIKGRNLHITFM